MSKKYNVFISHHGKDDDYVQRLKERLIENGYNIRNGSVDSTKHKDGRVPPKKVVERLLRKGISWAGTFICLVGEDTHSREWVDFEIKQAYEQGKRIVGIYAHGSLNAELPEALKKYGGAMLGWNSLDKLGEVIEGKNLPYENPDSSEQSTPIYTIKRVNC